MKNKIFNKIYFILALIVFAGSFMYVSDARISNPASVDTSTFLTALTPWTENIDGAGFNLTDVGTSLFNGLATFSQGILSQASSTFSGPIFVPTPTVGTHAVNKDYTDEAITSTIEFFFTDTASDITDLGVNTYVMADLPSGAVESSVVSSALTASTDDQLILSYAIASSTNPLGEIAEGLLDTHFHAERTSGTGALQVYTVLTKRDSSQVRTVIATSEISGLITIKEAISIHGTNLTDIDLDSSDRLVIEFYANTGVGAGKVVTIYQEGDTASHTSIPALSSVFDNIFLRQDGQNSPTANIDWGGFDITNAGNITATTFIGALTGTASGNLTSILRDSLTKGNFLIGDDSGNSIATSSIFIKSTGEVGIGTTTPLAKLTVDGFILSDPFANTDGATVTVDWDEGNVQSVTLEGDRTLAFSNIKIGGSLRLYVCQDGTGTRLLSTPAGVHWKDATAPTLSTGGGACDIMVYTTATSTATIYGSYSTGY